MYNLNIAYLVLFIFILIIHKVTCGKLARIKTSMTRYLFFNGPIRLLMETYLDVMLFSALNIMSVDWDASNESVQYSNYTSVVFLVLTIALPLVLLPLYLCNIRIVDEAKFSEKYGAALEGTNIDEYKDTEKSILLIPLLFFLRRALFTVSLLLWQEFLWG